MRTTLISLFILFATNIFAQSSVYDVNMEIKTNQVAQYPKGDEAFFKYVFENLKYTPEAKAAKLKGNVFFSFDVAIDSTISNFVFLDKVGYGVEEELEKIIKPLKFAPKLMNSKPFKSTVSYTIPVFAY